MAHTLYACKKTKVLVFHKLPSNTKMLSKALRINVVSKQKLKTSRYDIKFESQ